MSTLEYNNQVIGYSAQLRGFALKLTQNIADAQDLLQETLIKAITHRDKFIEATNLKAWLYTIMKNLFINNYRKTVKTRAVIDSNKDLANLQIAQEYGTGITEAIMREKDINIAVEGLGYEVKTPFKMYVDGYKYKEIAEHMGVPIGTVKSRIFFARSVLMKKVQEV